MSKKNKMGYVCSDCSFDSPKWMGQCPSCSAWNTMTEVNLGAINKASKAGRAGGGYAGTAVGRIRRVSEMDDAEFVKFSTKIPELDNVMDGGVTVGSVTIVSAEPGAGKTTLLTQAACAQSLEKTTLYATGEESDAQVTNRLKRIGAKYDDDKLLLVSETNVEAILGFIEERGAKFVIIDSIQVMHTDTSDGATGSVSQVRACAELLTQHAKRTGVTIFMVSHVTKGNQMAGPKTLEHIVDALFHIETNDGPIRTMRPKKNRFGDVAQVGIFSMTERGMLSVSNPSEIFLSGSTTESSGSVITCVRDGTRSLLLEIQCLATETEAEFPQRVVVGLNMNRVKMLNGVLRKHARIGGQKDTFFNVVGGLRVEDTETSIDLAAALALYSASNDIVIPRNICVVGELSLNGDVRPVEAGIARVREAASHGFDEIIIPDRNYASKMEEAGIRITRVKTLKCAIGRFKAA